MNYLKRKSITNFRWME